MSTVYFDNHGRPKIVVRSEDRGGRRCRDERRDRKHTTYHEERRRRNCSEQRDFDYRPRNYRGSHRDQSRDRIEPPQFHRSAFRNRPMRMYRNHCYEQNRTPLFQERFFNSLLLSKIEFRRSIPLEEGKYRDDYNKMIDDLIKVEKDLFSIKKSKKDPAIIENLTTQKTLLLKKMKKLEEEIEDVGSEAD